MKQMLPFLALLIVTFILAVGVNLALVVVQPELFGKKAQAVAVTDTTVAGLGLLTEEQRDSVMQAQDSLRVTQNVVDAKTLLADSLMRTKEMLAFEAARTAELTERLAVQEHAADSVKAKKRKDFAKMVESMSVEDAVRILENLDDEELRSVLMTVKKKQAGKILGAMDARRAAQVMN